MSVFDKFRSNPYQSTYIGAPIEEMAQAMAARTQRADQFYASEDALEDAFMQDSHFSADDALFNEKQASIRSEIEELANNPHQNGRRIKALSRQYASNQDLTLARKNYKAYKTWETEFEKDPTKYGGDVVAGRASNKLSGYGGASSGEALSFDRLYEHKDINETLMKAAATIKDNQNFTQTSDGRFINTVTKKYITEQEVAEVLMGSMKNDPTIMKQIAEHADYYGLDHNLYAQQLIAPQTQAIAHADFSSKLTALPKKGDGSGSDAGGPQMALSFAGPTMKDSTHDAFRGKDAGDMVNLIHEMPKDSEERALLESEMVEFWLNNAGSESSSNKDKNYFEYIKEKGMSAIDESMNGEFDKYDKWHVAKYGERGNLTKNMQRRLSSKGTSSWFGDEYGGGLGDKFADRYSTGRNLTIDDARTTLQGLDFSAGDASYIMDNAFEGLRGQNQIEMLGGEDGGSVTMGSQEFNEKYGDGKMVGFAGDSDIAVFKVSPANGEGPDETLYIRLPQEKFSLTAKRFNKVMAEGYGDGTNVNYATLGRSAMGLNRNLASQASVAVSRLHDGDTSITIELPNLNTALQGQGSFTKDADGNTGFIVNGKNLVKNNPKLQAELNKAVNTSNAHSFAGVLAALGQELPKK
jgi:hypothetical protein